MPPGSAREPWTGRYTRVATLMLSILGDTLTTWSERSRYHYDSLHNWSRTLSTHRVRQLTGLRRRSIPPLRLVYPFTAFTLSPFTVLPYLPQAFSVFRSYLRIRPRPLIAQHAQTKLKSVKGHCVHAYVRPGARARAVSNRRSSQIINGPSVRDTLL